MLSRLSVKKPMTVFVCVVLVLILGVMSFINMTTDLLPNMDLPYAIAYTTYIGASPEQVEQSVTKTLESALATTSGVKNITSISQENVSIVVLEFEEGTGMDSAMIEMNASLDQIADSLPEAAGSPVLMKINPDMLPIMVLAVDSDNMARDELSGIHLLHRHPGTGAGGWRGVRFRQRSGGKPDPCGAGSSQNR
ncbi:MAG: efflux RND transporter permease subunit [Angelakisella sp.]